MDPILNPFSPGAGAPPPELVGRGEILEQARILFGRTLVGRQEKSLIMTGLRGVGKTVLLHEIKLRAHEAGFKTIFVEASEDKKLPDLLVPHLRSLLFDLDRMAGISEKVKRSLRVFRSFVGTPQVTINDVTFGLSYDPEIGIADSGDLQADLTSLFICVAEAAKDRSTGVALLIDEIQYLSEQELAALIMAMHRLQQETLPFLLIAAGLPTIPALAGSAKSYAERLFSYPDVGALSRVDSDLALQEPVKEQGIEFSTDALDQIFLNTDGYPYFVQEWGYQCWNVAEVTPIGADVVSIATDRVIPRLDSSFFRVRYDRLTPAERRYLRAMASLDPGPCRAGDIAEALGAKTTSLGPVRAKLMSKGMVFSPAHGEMAFTVPLFGDFMKRMMPVLEEW
ncbi:MAG: ATP-binding protein [Fimbriimonadaceae bacterium]|nr:ATP-binding protein [Fimbriimonadaceae bacterium]